MPLYLGGLGIPQHGACVSAARDAMGYLAAFPSSRPSRYRQGGSSMSLRSLCTVGLCRRTPAAFCLTCRRRRRRRLSCLPGIAQSVRSTLACARTWCRGSFLPAVASASTPKKDSNIGRTLSLVSLSSFLFFLATSSVLDCGSTRSSRADLIRSSH